ncbi:fatty acid cis/trans isomerase [Thiobacillus sp.]|uniref:fatty acid cis/trans isomerase n=1 Tax=Thiobacillus sp. TaxID=924 RepID=UPI0025E6B611|nr:fatty acid cis/trans isomerase [Thiobacillus sp.]MBT9540827.1 fatty acid cis/trans isomerase [Thiobacillus sp.]
MGASRLLASILMLVLLAGCAAYTRHELDARFGQPDPGRAAPTQVAASVPHYRDDVKRIVDSRCVVCHGCYDAPCQLTLASHDGLRRGANPIEVYGTRLIETDPTRIHIDAQTPVAWRQQGFHAVLNERDPTPEANREASVIYRLLQLKRTHPQPEGGVLPAAEYDFSLDRKQVCPTVENVASLEKDHPQWGMPFGMPGLPDAEYQTLTRWIEAGAPYVPKPDLAAAQLERVGQWEAFLNGESKKSQLMARYVYEHWFLAHLYFDDLPPGEYFDLVRSKTPPGQPIQIIATRRPFDDPGVERVYYRLRRVEDTLLSKTHMPYALNPARMAKMTALFLDPDYAVEALPSYEPAVAANPFIAFQALPTQARYRFMLDEAQYTVMGFIKGPVCRGQVALSVINDYSWVFFLDPALGASDHDAAFLARELGNLQLPAQQGSEISALLDWKKYADRQSSYLRAKSEFTSAAFDGKRKLTLDAIWSGDGSNRNAALTIFRHEDSASVVQGLIGPQPQTVWLLGYPLLERIHYLLVAGYDVYGDVGHQLVTRLYMDFLRMEAQMNYLSLLPVEARDDVRDVWYRGASDDIKAYLDGSKAWFKPQSGIPYQTTHPNAELQQMLQQRLKPVHNPHFDLDGKGLGEVPRKQLARLAGLSGAALAPLPEVAFVALRGNDGQVHYYTLLHNKAYGNVSHLLDSKDERLPNEDTLTLVEGFLGAYPNAFFALNETDLPGFVDMVAALESEDDYRTKLMARYAIRRTDARFWPHSDQLLAAFRERVGVDAALFDYNRFENR